MSFFEAENLSAGYGKKKILDQISFEIRERELMGILGANGSGKTTLLRSVCNIHPHQGVCRLDGLVLEKLSAKEMAKRCSYIPQRSGISIDISVLDVVLMGFNPELGFLEHPNAEMRQRAVEVLQKTGLGEKINENYLHLSEGQKQLCILARTLVSERRMLLLDEPESALDFQFRFQMLRILRDYLKENNSGALAALHDPMLALNFCDRLLLLKDGKVLGELQPQKDENLKMEQTLSEIYGRVSLHRCQDYFGRQQLVMLKEWEVL